MSKKNAVVKQFQDGIINNNPVFVQLLGICPVLATTTSALKAISMGLLSVIVLVCSNLLISILRKYIPHQIRIASYIVIISGLVSLLDLLVKAYWYSVGNLLGIFIPLIVVNCIILSGFEVASSEKKVLPSVIDGLTVGLGFTVALIVIGSVREVLGMGTLFGVNVFGGWFEPAVLFVMAPGAFMVFGFVIALGRKMKERRESYAKRREEESKNVEREAVIWEE